MSDTIPEESKSNQSTGIAKTADSGKISFKSAGFSLKKQVKNPIVKQQPQHTSKGLFHDEDTTVSTKQVQLVSGFDQQSGAILHASEVKAEPKKEFVIPAVPNKDWRNEVLNKQVPINQVKGESKELIDTGSGNDTLTFGLNVTVRKDLNNTTATNEETESKAQVSRPIYMNNEEEDELMIEPISEQEAYNRDIAARPDAPDLDAYSRMPVEEFGAALLRGMGWNGDIEDSESSKEKDADAVIRRPALLGLGAKEVKDDTSTDKKLGSWGIESARTGSKNKKQERSYVPLVKVSKLTGKVIEEASEKAQSRDSVSRVREVSDSQDSSRRSSPRNNETEKYTERRLHRSERHSEGRSDRYSERSDRYSSRHTDIKSDRNSDRHFDRRSDRSDRHSDKSDRDRYSESYYKHRSSKETRDRSSGSSRYLDSDRYKESSTKKDYSTSRSSRKRHYDDSALDREKQKHSRSR